MDVLVRFQSRAFMDPTESRSIPHCELRLFEPQFAPIVASWVESSDELLQLSPSTPPPLTQAKVMEWNRSNGEPFLFFSNDLNEPVGYGELNSLQNKLGWFWLGHVIVRKDLRGSGLGQSFVKALARFAFEKRSAKRLALIVRPSNEAAVRCYENAGFIVTGEESRRIGNSGPRQRMLRMEMVRSTR